MTVTTANLRHLLSILVYGRNPVGTVYDSLGPDPEVALAPGWLNLGLWEGEGDDEEARIAPRRLVETLAEPLPRGGTVIDVGNGLGVQDPVIAEVSSSERLVAVNITESQLRAGRPRLESVGAHPVLADAVRLPLAEGSADGVISVEAAFHFRSRAAFFREVRRILRPGGILSMSDITTERLPRTPGEALAALINLRAWGLRVGAAIDGDDLVRTMERSGLIDVRIERVAERVFPQAFKVLLGRLDRAEELGAGLRSAARVLLSAMRTLWDRRLVDYVLVRARRS